MYDLAALFRSHPDYNGSNMKDICKWHYFALFVTRVILVALISLLVGTILDIYFGGAFFILGVVCSIIVSAGKCDQFTNQVK